MALHGEIACEIHSSTIAFKWMFKLHAIAVAHTTRVSTTAQPYEPYVSIPLPALILPPFEMNEFVRRGQWWRRGYPYMTANGFCLTKRISIRFHSDERQSRNFDLFIYLRIIFGMTHVSHRPCMVRGSFLISKQNSVVRWGKADDDEMVTKTNRNESDLIGSWS